jgi:S1-C subfamily serine protease
VLVRLGQIDGLDLHLFAFDMDITLAMFFLSPEGEVYARYGGRDAKDAENRQSLAGLRYTMQSVLDMHHSANRVFAPRESEQGFVIRGGRGRSCMHCHNVKEKVHADLKQKGDWTRDEVYRFPLPDSLGFILDVGRTNVVKTVTIDSPAARAGLEPGDVVRKVGQVPIHSLADVQYALDKVPAKGSVTVSWQRAGKDFSAALETQEGWRKSNVSWRPSLRRLIPAAHLYGTDLSADEKATMGLSPKQVAFRQQQTIHPQARTAGIMPGDIICGVDDKLLEMNVNGFVRYIRANYLIGDRVTIHVLREGKRLELPMTLVK